MKMKKAASLLLGASVLAGSLAGCSTGNPASEDSTSKNGTTTIEFWAAPNPPQQAYWKETAKAFEKDHPKIKIKVSPIKESPTSEASIQSAIAGKEAPTMSENINRGFAAQLAESKAIEPLNKMEGYDDILKSRSMSNTIKGWKFSDGNQYVLPIYSNAMLFGWRLDILKKLGVNEPPKTYSEVLDVTKKLKAKYPDKYLWAKPDLADPTAWKRWFDFFMLYDAASGGNKFIEGSKLVADDKAGVDVLNFMDNIRKEKGILTKQSKDPFETGLGIFTDIGPWTLQYWEEKFPEMKYNKTFAFSTPPVPDGTDTKNVSTFADTKGLVIYSSAPENEKKAAMEFIKWIYSKPENDVKWMEKTNLPPARDDLATNDAFKEIFEKNPALKPYAEAIPNAVPSIDNAKYNELQTYIGQYAVNPVVKGEVQPKKGWEKMKEAIEGDLK
ncbi:ABC transporter substrate-binding protein [Fictibacillus enclensis]|nr:ABC transporter substrate-binding protein [Fictibacillus enclensis]WHY72017.1 ABC transporter substrate-binding protein [Fictibacillus enclensis]